MRADWMRVSIRGTMQWAPAPAQLVSGAEAAALVGRAIGVDAGSVQVVAVRHGKGLEGLLDMTAFSDPVQLWSGPGYPEIEFVAGFEVAE